LIGNDIIDLAYTKETTNWQRRGFLAKVFNKPEQEIIAQTKEPFLMVWRLWSLKEAAYKSYLRKGGSPFNSPQRIAVSVKNLNIGEAQIGNFSFRIISLNTTDFILSHTQIPSHDRQVNEVFKISQSDSSSPSVQAYKKLFKRIAIDEHLDESALSIKKGLDRIPQLYLRDQKLEVNFSLSHHGQFGAFSFLKSV
jgi:phosphopantetheinyl transferase (holo-ACP synthase)